MKCERCKKEVGYTMPLLGIVTYAPRVMMI